jgi:hypothetical protein
LAAGPHPSTGTSTSNIAGSAGTGGAFSMSGFVSSLGPSQGSALAPGLAPSSVPAGMASGQAAGSEAAFGSSRYVHGSYTPVPVPPPLAQASLPGQGFGVPVAQPAQFYFPHARAQQMPPQTPLPHSQQPQPLYPRIPASLSAFATPPPQQLQQQQQQPRFGRPSGQSAYMEVANMSLSELQPHPQQQQQYWLYGQQRSGSYPQQQPYQQSVSLPQAQPLQPLQPQWPQQAPAQRLVQALYVAPLMSEGAASARPRGFQPLAPPQAPMGLPR